jgi:hypothetical protein
VKNVLLVNALLIILFLSDTYGGRMHDLRIAEATPYPNAVDLRHSPMRASYVKGCIHEQLNEDKR